MSVNIEFWDVQHGHATYINTPNNRHIVIDLGTGSYGYNQEFSPLRHLKYTLGIDQLDYVVVSHPHKDHIDDIMNFDLLNPKIFSRPQHLTKEDILKNVQDEDMYLFEKYFEINSIYQGEINENHPDDPDNPGNYGGVMIKGYNPWTCSNTNINNHSLVRVIEYAETKVVLPGDNESCSWEELLNNSEFKSSVKNADILLASHHGRISGYHDEFVSLVNPCLTIISDGAYCDSSATSRYNAICRGWTVHKRSGGSENRKCLTTRNDGVISVSFGYNYENKPYLSVSID